MLQTTVQEFIQPSDGRDDIEPLEKENSHIYLSSNGHHAVLAAGNTLQFYQVSSFGKFQ